MKHYRKKNINRVIPILKHLELCRKLSKILLDVIEKNNSNESKSIKSIDYINSNSVSKYKNLNKNKYKYIN